MAGCPCTLVATAERIKGTLSAEDRELLELMDQADANAPMFEAHMTFEEQVIGPLMNRGDLYRLKAEHAYIRRMRKRSLVVSPTFVTAHAEWERKIFPTIGAGSPRSAAQHE